MKASLEKVSPFIEKIRHTLEEEVQRLLRDLHAMADEDPNQPGTFIPKPPTEEIKTDDDGSVDATAISDNAPIINQLQQELRDAKKALQAVQDGTYGYCKYCKEAIDPKRLEARPTSSACIACKKTLTQEA